MINKRDIRTVSNYRKLLSNGAALSILIREVPSSNLVPETDYLMERFNMFPQYFQTNSALVSANRTRQLPSAFFKVHPLILTFDTT
jgi:hypothetical protein